MRCPGATTGDLSKEREGGSVSLRCGVGMPGLSVLESFCVLKQRLER